MTMVTRAITAGILPQEYARTLEHDRCTLTDRRLTGVYRRAKEIPFDDSSRIIFFSDCHRGDNSRADMFSANQGLFLHALSHYYHAGFTYVELGDGDELWQNRRFRDIQRAHRPVFDLLHRFDRQDRLHLVVGNHDIQRRQQDRVEKEGIIAQEGLILRHSRTGQRIFCVHGHQADFVSDGFSTVGRPLVRYLGRPARLLGLGRGSVWSDEPSARTTIERQVIDWLREQTMKIERRIVRWVRNHHQIVVCGHTHHPVCATRGAPAYFNTGSCTQAGCITGLEIQDGEIRLVKWSNRASGTQGNAQPIERHLLAPPRKLCLVG